ncbi:hypothetical protein TNCT1_37470 [Streptomyces sp. 1-11]|nr:hypothetical protein TNCT1_37470 [Streptomyces sp. 1-11]
MIQHRTTVQTPRPAAPVPAEVLDASDASEETTDAMETFPPERLRETEVGEREPERPRGEPEGSRAGPAERERGDQNG